MESIKCIALLVKKHSILNTNSYLYEPIMTLKGNYDSEREIFMSEVGETYYHLLKNDFLVFEADFAIMYPTSYNNLKELFKSKTRKLTFDELVIAYKNEHMIESYFATYNYSTNQSQVITIDMDTFIEKMHPKINNNQTTKETPKIIDENQLDNKKITDPFEFNFEYETNTKNHNIKQENNNIEDMFKIEDAYNEVIKQVIAQNNGALRIITEISKMVVSGYRKNILLTGSTGVGKTALMKAIGNVISKDVFIVDALQISSTAYKGSSIEEILYSLYLKCDKDKERLENSIIVFDEIDKKGSRRKDDPAGQRVLMSLLKFLDGTTYLIGHDINNKKDMFEINTNKMIKIASGSFSDVYKDMTIKGLGYNSELREEKEPTTEDFVEKAMIPDEVMGRLEIIIKLNDLSVDNLIEIIEKSTMSAWLREKETFNKFNVKLTATDGYLRRIAEKAYNKKTGARALNGIISDTTWKPYAIIEKNSGMYDEVKLTEETVDNIDSFQLIKRK